MTLSEEQASIMENLNADCALLATTTAEGVYYWTLKSILIRGLTMTSAFLVMLVGAYATLRSYLDHPRTSIYLVSAMGLYVVNLLGLPAAEETLWYYRSYYRPVFFVNPDLAECLIKLPGGILDAAIWILILAAVFDSSRGSSKSVKPSAREIDLSDVRGA